MRLVMSLLFCLFVSSTALAGGSKPVRLFILSGQSNMKHLEPGEVFTPAIEKAFPENENVIVKLAFSGELIRMWCKDWKLPPGAKASGAGQNGAIYDKLMSDVKAAMKGKPAPISVTYLWMQGEADGMQSGYGSAYRAALEGMIGQLKKDLGRDDIDVIIGRISDLYVKNPQYPDWDMVREAEVDYAEKTPRTAWIDTDDMNDTKIGNGLHYTADGYQKLGERFAAKAIEMIQNPATAAKPDRAGAAK